MSLRVGFDSVEHAVSDAARGQTINVAFTYSYGLRMRSNSYPKPIYLGALFIDEAPFVATDIAFYIQGRPDESKMVIDRYSLRIANQSAPKMIMPLIPVWLFTPRELVRIELSRGEPQPPKLWKRKDGGRGIFITVQLRGMKQYPVPTRTPEPPGSDSTKTDPED
jgi:hypothetical protein